MKGLALAVGCLCVAFGAGLAVGRSAPQPSSLAAPLAEPAPIPVALPLPDRAYRSELTSTRTQLAICLAFRAPPESSAPMPGPSSTAPPGEWDEETARLVRTKTTNTEWVMVALARGGKRVFPSGTWPPVDGPEPGSRIVARFVDGGVEHYRDGGVTEFVATDPAARPSWFPPCPKDTDAGAAP